jgi:siroheme synthase
MAIANFGAIASRLIELGHPDDLPVAVIENGTTDQQRVIRSTLKKLPTIAAEQNIQSPALLLIGQTVRYAQRYGWFNPRTVEADADNGFAKVI